MKSKKALWLFATGLFLFTTACSNNEDSEQGQEKDQEEVKCEEKNDIFFLVEKYGYQYDTTYAYNGKFNVVRSEYTLQNDSTAIISLFNYEQGKSGNDNHEIRIELHAKNGKKIEAANYPYMEYSEDYWCSTTINSDKGRVYFNWNAGMPDQGYVEVVHVNDKEVCGKFQLRVENMNSATIGHVELSGTWKAEN